VLQGELETKSKFWGKSVEVILGGAEELRTQPWGDAFRWGRATICIMDVVLGNYWIQMYGKFKLFNATTGVWGWAERGASHCLWPRGMASSSCSVPPHLCLHIAGLAGTQISLDLKETVRFVIRLFNLVGCDWIIRECQCNQTWVIPESLVENQPWLLAGICCHLDRR
jgi:hypothetical protein